MEIESPEETVVNISATSDSSVTRVVTRDRQHRSIVMRVKDDYLLKFGGNYFLISCVLALSMDPLFLYIPLIDEDLKCVRPDSKLTIVAMIIRTLSDIYCLFDIYCFIRSYWMRNAISTGLTNKTRTTRYWRLSGLFARLFAIIPIPQIYILHVLPMEGPDSSSSRRKLRSSMLVLQYVPRVLRVYELQKDWVNPDTNFHSRTRIGGLFMFFVFILASHILGAFWYYFSFERNIDCWLSACTRENQCQFGCHRDNSTRNITLLNDLCPINLPNATVFNFGIYLDALQSGMLNSTDFPRKLLHCFWWGLRNLSSFGQNLQTSTYAWENLFAVLICMIGMLVVLVYLTAILQTYMQMEAKKSQLLEITDRRTTDIETWLCANELSGALETGIMKQVQDNLKPDEDVSIVSIFSVLPWQIALEIKKDLCLDMLRKVPKFNAGGDRLLESICKCLKPEIYTENSFIFQEGDPVNKMFFITQGVAFIYRTNSDGSGSSNTSLISKGDHYGEQLLNLAPDVDLFYFSIPRSDWNVKCSTNVEAFFLIGEDLRRIILGSW